MKEGHCWKDVRWIPSVLFALVFFLPAAGWAADLHFTSETRLRWFERDTLEKDDANVVPAYEYVQVDYGKRGEGELSFHLFGWGRADFGGGDYFEDDTAGELLYGYLEYAAPKNLVNLRLGRQYVFEGVSNESIDGLRASADITPYFHLSAYGGQPVALDSTDGRHGDRIWGARLSNRFQSWYELGVSFKQVNNDSDREEEFVGIDLSASLPFGVSLSGLSSRNLENEGWAEHSYELRFNLADYRIRPFFEQYEYEDLFDTGDNSDRPFTLLLQTGERLRVFGADAVRFLSGNWEAGVKAKLYNYETRGDSSRFYSALLNWFGGEEEDLTSAGGELGYMEGDAAANDFILTRLWFYLDRLEQLAGGFVTGDVVYVLYDEEIADEDTSLFLSLGAGRKFLRDALELKLSGDYSSDPFLEHDVRGMLVATYVFDR
jgi:hypothetical protein